MFDVFMVSKSEGVQGLMENETRVRVAVVQAAAPAFDTAACLKQVDKLAREASAMGAKLVLFPETFIPGFPAALDWAGPATAFRDDAGTQDFARYRTGAIYADGSEVAQLAALAGELGIQIHVGAMERAGSSLWNSVFSFGQHGELLGIRRKLMPTHGERTIWAPAPDATSVEVHETPLGRVGAVICWESYMPLLRMALYGEGIEIYLAPTADDTDGWLASMRHIALEGRCYVLSACQYAMRADYPADYAGLIGHAPEMVMFSGGSVIIGPDGSLLAGPLRDETGILYADLDRTALDAAKHTLDVAGHYARPDLFTLTIDRRPRKASGVNFLED